MRYYEQEHFDAYARIRTEGLTQWNDLHDEPGASSGYDDFPNRSFLARVLPTVTSEEATQLLEYGCGTGPAACYLARRGYEVHAIDLVPDAIAVARSRAAERGLQIRFEVQDICLWGEDNGSDQFDVVVDSFCLQSIVLDQDRSRVLNGVRRRLRAGGRYLISTAMYQPDRDYEDDFYDSDTGIIWMPTTGPHVDGVLLDGGWYLPHRRHLTAHALRAELEKHGFRVMEQSASGGDVVCVLEEQVRAPSHSDDREASGVG